MSAPEVASPPQPGPGPGRAQVKVVYVMGAGHSGSTILGVTLGNCEGFFYAGEVEEWLVKRGEPDLGGSERTRFWRAVREQIAEAEPLFGGEVNRCLERSSSIFRVDRWARRRRLRDPYRRVTSQLYAAIARASGCEHVVDTSHFPLRAREVRALEGVQLYLLYLSREPQGVIDSELRGVHPQDGAERRLRTLTTNANLWLTNLLSLAVFLTHPRERRMFVRHEDFLADPAGVVGAVLGLLGSTASIPDLTALHTGSPLLGNKLLRSEVVALRAPRAHEGSRRSLLTAVMQLPWRAVFARLRPDAHAAATCARRERRGEVRQPARG